MKRSVFLPARVASMPRPQRAAHLLQGTSSESKWPPWLRLTFCPLNVPSGEGDREGAALRSTSSPSPISLVFVVTGW
jgi:hypothetical protein